MEFSVRLTPSPSLRRSVAPLRRGVRSCGLVASWLAALLVCLGGGGLAPLFFFYPARIIAHDAQLVNRFEGQFPIITKL